MRERLKRYIYYYVHLNIDPNMWFQKHMTGWRETLPNPSLKSDQDMERKTRTSKSHKHIT